MYLRRLCATAIVLTTPFASASTLNALDSDPIIAIHGNQAGPTSELGEALGQLDWAGLRRTAATLLRETTRDVPDEVIDYLESGTFSTDELPPACEPAITALLSTTDYALGVYGPENSFFPGFKLQIKPETMPAKPALDTALRECFMLESVTADTFVFNQGPMPIYIHRDDSVIQIDSQSTWDKVGTGGFATQIGQKFPDRPATQHNFVLNIDFEAITQLAQPFVMMSGELDPAVVGLMSETLSTLGELSVSAYYDGEALSYETLNTPAAGYSTELYDLMLCKSCKAPKPLNIRSENMLSSYYNNMPELADWLVKRLGKAFPDNPEFMAVAPFVDTLFGWMGDDMHLAMQDSSYTIPNLLKSNMVFVFDTTGPEQRDAALSMVKDFAAPAIESLNQFGMDDLSDFAMLHTDSHRYRGIEINRVRMGPTLDLTTALVNEQAILSMNPMSIRSLIDDMLDDTTPPTRYADLITEAKENNGSAVAWGNIAPQMRDIAALLDITNQFLSSVAAAEFADYRPSSALSTERNFRWDGGINPTATVSPRGAVNQTIAAPTASDTMHDFDFIAQTDGVLDLSVYSNDIYLNTMVHETDAENKVTGSFVNIESATEQTIFTIPVKAGRLYLVDISSDSTSPGEYTYEVALTAGSETSEPVSFGPAQVLKDSTYQGGLNLDSPATSVFEISDNSQSTQVTLADLAPNTRYTVSAASSDDLDLSLVNTDTGMVVHYNDDRSDDNLNPAITFTTEANAENLVAVVKAVENPSREVIVDLTLQPAVGAIEPEPAKIDFTTLLEAGDVLVDSVDMMADYMGESYSAYFVEENAVRSKGRFEVR